METLQIEMSEVKVRDRKVFRLLFDTFFPRACFFAGQLLNDPEAGTDVAQDAFVAIWEKGERYANLLVFKTYLYTTLKNKCLNVLRNKPQTTDVSNMKELATDDVRVDFLMIQQEIKGRILCEINKLPAIKREIILLRLEGKSYEEISRELRLSLNTVKTHKKDSYKQLRLGLSKGSEKLTMMCIIALSVLLG